MIESVPEEVPENKGAVVVVLLPKPKQITFVKYTAHLPHVNSPPFTCLSTFGQCYVRPLDNITKIKSVHLAIVIIAKSSKG